MPCCCSRYKGIRPRQVTEQEYAQLSARALNFEDQLASNPKDLGAMEALAVTYAKMQDYPKASGLLDQLVAARPDYGDAWRLLGEASLLSGEAGRSVTAYEKALELAPGSQTVLTVRRRGWERRSSAIGICICSRRPHAT